VQPTLTDSFYSLSFLNEFKRKADYRYPNYDINITQG